MSNRRDDLRRLFGDYRFEWRPTGLGALFVEPPYFGELLALRPTFLIGGRGTGKTTALRSLITEYAPPAVPQTILGIYIRINKNRVRAFEGGGRETRIWARAFAHYFNLLAAVEFIRVCLDREARGGPRVLDRDASSRLANAFGLNQCDMTSSYAPYEQAIGELELYVNNTALLSPPLMSIAEAPLKAMAAIAARAGLTLYCCIDEYENLLDYQQEVLNAYIKHAEAPLTYKVGVRGLGLRTRSTTGGGDLLVEPDDYSVVELANEPFDEFALAVAQRRLAEAERLQLLAGPLERAWPELSRREEALALGAARFIEDLKNELSGDARALEWVQQQAPGDLYFAKYWADSSGNSLRDTVTEALADSDAWCNRLNNHGYASLFWLSRGRKGARIRKYYSGIQTLLQLAGGNIRYFLELLDVSLQLELSKTDSELPSLEVTPATQTEAARVVGKRRLDALEALSEVGVDLRRLVLALGKVFFELARAPEGRAPEVTQFVVAGAPLERSEVERLLREGSSHQALECRPRTKATSEAEMRDDEYRLHPIFSPYFEFSHRRKRRLSVLASDLLLIRRNPRQAIARMLHGTPQSGPDEWPEQLTLYEPFYESSEGDVS